MSQMMDDMCDSLISRALREESDITDVMSESQSAAPASSHQISAFCLWTSELVEIEYPLESSPWMFRADCSSYAQHRWSLFHSEIETIQLVVKHNSCQKYGKTFEIVQPLCKKCRKQKEWHLPCETPQNVFYLLKVSSDIYACDALLETLIKRRLFITKQMISCFLKSQPKPVFGIRTPTTFSKRRDQIKRLTSDVKKTVVKTNVATMEANLNTLLSNECNSTHTDCLNADHENTSWSWNTASFQMSSLTPKRNNSLLHNEAGLFQTDEIADILEAFTDDVYDSQNSSVQTTTATALTDDLLDTFSNAEHSLDAQASDATTATASTDISLDTFTNVEHSLDAHVSGVTTVSTDDLLDTFTNTEHSFDAQTSGATTLTASGAKSRDLPPWEWIYISPPNPSFEFVCL